ncbi:MAG: glutamate-5-semialdehyde dehydrogenase [Terrimicrobiaceae bacterium]
MQQSVDDLIRDMGRKARVASRELAKLSTEQRNAVLLAMADELEASSHEVLSANAVDLDAATHAGLTAASIDRLRLDEKRLSVIASSIRDVAHLEDPVGKIIAEWDRPNGLRISKIRTPIGVVGIIYESRPNVTADAAVLCIKTGNAVLLRGGSESLRSNLAIAAALQRGGENVGLPAQALQLVPITDREAVRALAQMDEFLDVIVPRGGHGLIKAVVEHARMPVIKHYHGVCAVYVHDPADLTMAANIAVNSKCQRPGVCNAMETLLVHSGVAPDFFRATAESFAKHAVEMRVDARAKDLLASLDYQPLREATAGDWTTEFLEMILAVKVVDSLDEAINHINTYGSHHSDSIVTTDQVAAERFLAEVDSAAVYWNASTRFTDGGEFGFGAEIGISTDKLHARGPMGLEELTTYKYLVRGTGQLRS